jgi:1-aminocyclopropane-1-carboxylate deaminase
MLDVYHKIIPVPIQKINSELGYMNLSILRLDLIQSWADGNKFYKLKNNIAFAVDHKIKIIVSKGGMFSNHLYSLAHACLRFEIKLVCVVRSYGPDPDNPLMQELTSMGHEIIYLPPEKYQQFTSTEAFIHYPGSLFLPEGGMNDRAIDGAKEIMNECNVHHPTHIIISGGTMTTACGLLAAADEDMKIIIVPSWKGCTNEYVEKILIQYNITPKCAWEIWPDAHFGGFAKYDQTLIEFMCAFTNDTGIPLDPVYTGKMMYAVSEKMKGGYFSDLDSLLAIHTGGLQGIRGFSYRYPKDWSTYADLVSTTIGNRQ